MIWDIFYILWVWAIWTPEWLGTAENIRGEDCQWQSARKRHKWAMFIWVTFASAKRWSNLSTPARCDISKWDLYRSHFYIQEKLAARWIDIYYCYEQDSCKHCVLWLLRNCPHCFLPNVELRWRFGLFRPATFSLVKCACILCCSYSCGVGNNYQS